MRFSSIRSRIMVPYAVLIALVAAGVATYVLGFTRQNYMETLGRELLVQAQLIGQIAEPALRQDDLTAIARITQEQSAVTETRLTLIAADGTVLGDSASDAQTMPSHLFRAEIQQALSDGQGMAIRYSETVGYDMVYAAVPVYSEDALQGFARVAVPLRAIDQEIGRVRANIIVATAGAVIVALLLGFGIAETTARPIRRLTRAVQRMAAGDLTTRLLARSSDEVGTLTRDMNAMAERLRETIQTLSEERAQLEAILEHMGDGIIITDGRGRVRMVNLAASRMLDIARDDALGHSFVQVVRDHRIVGVMQACLAGPEEQEELIGLTRRGVFLHVVATPLWAADDEVRCLLVLQDLSQVRRLEVTRSEFMSNISHELRTPLASLRALAETLRDGALDDRPAALHFLERIDAEVDALTQMVGELMELSRIESGQVPMRLAPTPAAEVVVPAVDRLRPQAERAELCLDVDLPDSLPLVLADVDRLRQVVTNLVHNAIKFTPPGGEITVAATVEDERVVFSVTDTGEGIAPAVLPRVFERFYKADRSRSGRGTGLGLAIAKHIVQSHGGEIWVESVEGQGSTFRFTVLLAAHGRGHSGAD